MGPTQIPQTANEIIAALEEAFAACTETMQSLSKEALHHAPEGKWTPAQNLDHLIKSTEPLAKGLKLPPLVFRGFGKPNRPRRSYEELVARYKEKLAQGGVASSAYTASEKALDPAVLLDRWQSTTADLLQIVSKKWTKEDKLDKYLLPHPLLGKLMVREMLFFTVHHTWHHIKAMSRTQA